MSITIEPRHDYLTEILRTWGLHDAARDVWIVPPGADVNADEVERRANDGALIIAVKPDSKVAERAGLELEGPRDLPGYLRMTGFITQGLAGEMIPIVGEANLYKCDDNATPVGWLCDRTRYGSDSPGIVETPVGRGRIVTIAFDLPLCVMLLRQGDPARAGYVPEGDGCERPSHMAYEFESADAAWCPYADLLARMMVSLIERHADQPVPLLHHLPGDAPSVLLYSGDEDYALVSENEEQMANLESYGGRMDLYIITDHTHSTPEDIARYAEHHDIGPHPNLRPIDGKPIEDKLERLESQIDLFKSTYGITPLTVRNHCTAWAGYMQHVEVLERCGIRMDGSYFSSDYMRGRRYAPYQSFGAAMPMRFVRTDGSLIDVYQQHTQYSDDVAFSPDAEYSYRFSAEAFATMIDRVCRDACERFRTPVAVCIHPSNRPPFSRDSDIALLDAAKRHGMPIWSFTQWCQFWIEREKCTFSNTQWSDSVLRFTVTNPSSRSDLCVALPNDGLKTVRNNGQPVEGNLIRLNEGQNEIEASYGEGAQ